MIVKCAKPLKIQSLCKKLDEIIIFWIIKKIVHIICNICKIKTSDLVHTGKHTLDLLQIEKKWTSANNRALTVVITDLDAIKNIEIKIENVIIGNFGFFFSQWNALDLLFKSSFFSVSRHFILYCCWRNIYSLTIIFFFMGSST